jgi:hypothetical protein
MVKKKDLHHYSDLHPITLRLRKDQVNFLNNLQTETISRRKDIKRTNDTQRITKNTYIRCLVDILIEKHNKLELDNISNEADLLTRLKKILK